MAVMQTEAFVLVPLATKPRIMKLVTPPAREAMPMLTDEEIWAQRPHLMSHALRMTKHREDAEDLVQDVMLTAITKKTQFTVGTNLAGWLYSILRTTNINRHRRNNCRPQLSTSIYLDLAGNSSVEDEVMYDQFDPLLAEAISLLTQDQQEVLSMTYLDGLSNAEIAALVGIQVGTVRTRMFRARVHLRRTLAAAYPERLPVTEHRPQGPSEVSAPVVAPPEWFATEEEAQAFEERIAAETAEIERRYAEHLASTKPVGYEDSPVQYETSDNLVLDEVNFSLRDGIK